jgi:hypothetical protein
MSQELLDKRIEKVIDKLRISQMDNDEKSIQKYINKLNELWLESSEEMKKNARKDGFDV